MAESKLVHEEETAVPNHHEVSRKSFPDCFYLQLGNVVKFRIPSCLSKTGGWSSSSINKVLFIWNKGSSISPGHHKDNQQLLFCYITIPCGNPLFLSLRCGVEALMWAGVGCRALILLSHQPGFKAESWENQTSQFACAWDMLQKKGNYIKWSL